MWVNNFQAPEIRAVLSSFFHDGNDIAGGSNRGGRWVEGGLNIGVKNGIQRQFKAIGPVWGPTGPFLYSQYPKLKITDNGQPFMACPALQAPIQESYDHLMVPKCNLRLTQGLMPQKPDLWLWSKWNMILY